MFLSQNELSNCAESPASLLDAYHLRDKIDEGIDKATEVYDKLSLRIILCIHCTFTLKKIV